MDSLPRGVVARFALRHGAACYLCLPSQERVQQAWEKQALDVREVMRRTLVVVLAGGIFAAVVFAAARVLLPFGGRRPGGPGRLAGALLGAIPGAAAAWHPATPVK